MASHLKTIQKLVEAFNKHDAATIAKNYAEDAVVYDPIYDKPLRGRAAIDKDAREFLAAFPDIRVTNPTIMESNGEAAFRAPVSGTHEGALTGPDGQKIEATHKRLETEMAVFCRFDDKGLIREEHRYYDIAGMMKQLGLTESIAA